MTSCEPAIYMKKKWRHTVFPRIIAWAIILFFAQKGGDYWRKGDYFKCLRLKGAIIRGGARLIEGRLLFEEIRYFVRVWSPRGQIKPKPRTNGSPLGV